MKSLKILKKNFYEQQYNFIKCPAQMKALVTGYGYGKTRTGIKESLKHHLNNFRDDNNRSNGWVIYPTLALADELFVEPFKRELEKKRIKYKYNSANHYFQTTYGDVRVYTLERPEKMIGANLTWCYCDEFDVGRYKNCMLAFKKILGRLRGNNYAQLFITTTPEGFAATHQIFVENEAANKVIFHAKTTDNPLLPSNYVELLKQEYDEKMLQAYLNGQFVNLNSGSVYYTFNRGVHLSEEVMVIDKNLPLRIFFDFNVFPFSVGWAQHKSKADIRFLGEWISKSHSTTKEACIVLRNTLPSDVDVVIYGDASGSSLGTKSKASDYQIIDDELKPYFDSLKYKVPKKNPAVRTRVNTFNARFEKSTIRVNKCCKSFIRDCEQVTWNEKGTDIDKSNIKLTHASDGGGYYLCAEFPIIKPSTQDLETKSF